MREEHKNSRTQVGLTPVVDCLPTRFNITLFAISYFSGNARVVFKTFYIIWHKMFTDSNSAFFAIFCFLVIIFGWYLKRPRSLNLGRVKSYSSFWLLQLILANLETDSTKFLFNKFATYIASDTISSSFIWETFWLRLVLFDIKGFIPFQNSVIFRKSRISKYFCILFMQSAANFALLFEGLIAFLSWISSQSCW